jgi:hypothetical protein
MRAGTSSSIAELIAEYSPPMPAPASARNSTNTPNVGAKPLAAVATR